MPLHTYRLPSGDEVEHLVMPGEEVPDHLEVDGERARRVPSAPGIVRLNSPFHETSLYKRGKAVWEPGMDREIARNKRHMEAKRAKKRRTTIENTVRDMNSVTVNR